MTINSKSERPTITVSEFVSKAPEDLHVKVLSGAAGQTDRLIESERIQKLGLALAGFPHYIHHGRIQIVGQSEISYISQLSASEREAALANLDPGSICCILLTKDLDPPPELERLAEASGMPMLQTPLVSSKAISIVTNFLQEQLAPHTTMHGVLLGMYGLGVLMTGESGIGKSECALDLISRGHSLISDDSVFIKKIGTRLEGDSPELTREHLEIHGLGIVNIRSLFGVSSIAGRTPISLCIELKRWNDVIEIERLGLEMAQQEIFGVSIPKFVLPVSPGRNLSIIVETAVRMHLLRSSGFDAAQLLIEKHNMLVGRGNSAG